MLLFTLEFLIYKCMQVVEWLSDLTWVPNGAIVLISTVDGQPSTKSATCVSGVGGGDREGDYSPDYEPTKKRTAATARMHEARDVGDGEEGDEEESLALAALDRIRDSYNRRARGRAGQAFGGLSNNTITQEQASKDMSERRRVVQGMERFQQVRYPFFIHLYRELNYASRTKRSRCYRLPSEYI